MQNLKRLAIATAIVAILFCAPAVTRADTTEVDGSTWSYSLTVAPDYTTNATITAVTPSDGPLVVPSAVDGYRIVAIADVVGKDCGGITSPEFATSFFE